MTRFPDRCASATAADPSAGAPRTTRSDAVVMSRIELVRAAAAPRATKPSIQGTGKTRWSFAQSIVYPSASAASAHSSTVVAAGAPSAKAGDREVGAEEHSLLGLYFSALMRKVMLGI